tara:strand:- start:379 stop:567 length:189 start_codon:yes stop_codon:yes gene_type:complete
MNQKEFLDDVRSNQDRLMAMLEEDDIQSLINDAAQRGIKLGTEQVSNYVDLLAKALLVVKFR